MNMQLTAWRERAAANQAFVAGAGDALGTWRQPGDRLERAMPSQPSLNLIPTIQQAIMSLC